MVKFKKSVVQTEVQPPIWFALGIAYSLYRDHNRELVVTSMRDSHENKPLSFHNKGLAADIRTKHLSPQEQTNIFVALKNILDFFGYDVVLETDHIHYEYDPKDGEDWQLKDVA